MTITIKANLQLIYATDIKRSMVFYKSLFDAEPVYESARYVAFAAGGDVLFAIWSGGITPDVSIPRFSEIGIMLPSNEDVDRVYSKWKICLGIDIVQEPSTEVFGRTFLARDPDGHLIRVCPLD